MDRIRCCIASEGEGERGSRKRERVLMLHHITAICFTTIQIWNRVENSNEIEMKLKMCRGGFVSDGQ